MPVRDSELAVLARPGGNERVVGKKVLLAHLARQEAARLGIAPTALEVTALGAAFLKELGLADDDSVAAWLAHTGLSAGEFQEVLTDLASVLAVEAHLCERIAPRVELHRRFIEARLRTLAESS